MYIQVMFCHLFSFFIRNESTQICPSLDQLLGKDARQLNAGQNLSQANISPRSSATE